MNSFTKSSKPAPAAISSKTMPTVFSLPPSTPFATTSPTSGFVSPPPSIPANSLPILLRPTVPASPRANAKSFNSSLKARATRKSPPSSVSALTPPKPTAPTSCSSSISTPSPNSSCTPSATTSSPPDPFGVRRLAADLAPVTSLTLELFHFFTLSPFYFLPSSTKDQPAQIPDRVSRPSLPSIPLWLTFSAFKLYCSLVLVIPPSAITPISLPVPFPQY